jgi:hypothetical protein
MSSTETYSPRPRTVAWRVIDFLQRNDGEMLSKADIAAKFDCGEDSVDTVLQQAMRADFVNKARSDGLTVWRLGITPVKLLAAPRAKGDRDADDDGRPVQRWTRAKNVEFDPSAIEVRKKTPLRTPEQARRDLFDAFLKKLEVGDSAEFEERGLITMKHHVKRYSQATGHRFTLRALGEGLAGIERVA